MKDRRTLVLNSDYNPVSLYPLHHISAKSAIIRVLNDTCYTIEEYEDEIKTQNPNVHIKWPAVIVRKQFISKEYFTPLNKYSLFYRDKGLCAYCSKELKLSEDITLDHVIPESLGGKRTWENSVLACTSCNAKKGSLLPNGIWKPPFKPFKPNYWQLLEVRRNFPLKIYHKSWIDYIQPWHGELRIETYD